MKIARAAWAMALAMRVACDKEGDAMAARKIATRMTGEQRQQGP